MNPRKEKPGIDPVEQKLNNWIERVQASHLLLAHKHQVWHQGLFETRVIEPTDEDTSRRVEKILVVKFADVKEGEEFEAETSVGIGMGVRADGSVFGYVSSDGAEFTQRYDAIMMSPATIRLMLQSETYDRRNREAMPSEMVNQAKNRRSKIVPLVAKR